MNDVYKDELRTYLNHLYDELGMLQNEVYDLRVDIKRIEEELQSLE